MNICIHQERLEKNLCRRVALQERPQGPGREQADSEPAVCSCGKHGQQCNGLREGSITSLSEEGILILCSTLVRQNLLLSLFLDARVYEGDEHIGTSAEHDHEND